MEMSWALKLGLRWLVSSLGLYIATGILGGQRLNVSGSRWAVLVAGLLIALVNMAIKPLMIILSFPAIILSLGLFMLVINGCLILLASWLYHPLYVKNLGVAIITGIIIGVVNYLITHILEDL